MTEWFVMQYSHGRTCCHTPVNARQSQTTVPCGWLRQQDSKTPSISLMLPRTLT
jgi:hypothetical protein